MNKKPLMYNLNVEINKRLNKKVWILIFKPLRILLLRQLKANIKWEYYKNVENIKCISQPELIISNRKVAFCES